MNSNFIFIYYTISLGSFRNYNKQINIGKLLTISNDICEQIYNTRNPELTLFIHNLVCWSP